jgi:hypothetical protein
MSDAILVTELLGREPLYSLTGADGCECAYIRLRGIDIDVHCHRSSHFFTNYYGESFRCNCQFTGVHLTPLEPSGVDELLVLGRLIRRQVRRSSVTIVVHEARNESAYVSFTPPPKGQRPKETIVGCEESEREE